MKVAICHLSDIHLCSNKNNPVLDKVDKIGEAIASNLINEDQLFILLSGDIAYSGKEDEYIVALEFIAHLEEAVIKAKNELNINYILVPGNHDCDFDLDNEARQLLINSVRSKDKVGNSIINNCICIQESFSNFANLLSLRYKKDELHNVEEFMVGGKKILFQSFNTAWMSKINEKQGELILPINKLHKIDPNKYDLVISMFHHPLNWLESNNKREFKKYIESTSDIIITGHEHVSEKIKTQTDDKYANEYFTGGVLQENESKSASCFNIICIDLVDNNEKFVQYYWDGEIYKPQHNYDLKDFKRNKYIENQWFVKNKIFKEFLNDPGVNLIHPKKDTIFIQDIYIYPNLKIISNNLNTDNIITDERSKDFIKNSRKVVVIGDEKSGKTSLGKMLYTDLLNDGVVPLFIEADKLKDVEEDKIIRIIEKSFAEQYNSNILEKYRQLAKSNKAIIIDDFNKSLLNDTGRSILLSTITNMFDYVIIFADESFRINKLVKNNQTNIQLNNYVNCEILECGYIFRCNLVKKWNEIGRNELEIFQDQSNICIDIENKINTAIGKNLLPKYPIFILLILQQFEMSRSINTNLSTYGYLYESLIIRDLTLISILTDDIDMYSTYLGELAYYIFNKKPKVLDFDEIDSITEIYNCKYRMKLHTESTISKLIEARIIENKNNHYSFKHDFAYYYYVARYMRDEIDSEEVINHIKNMSCKLFNESYSNVVLFLCHLTKNPFVISVILSSSKEIFKKFKPYDLNEHIKVIKTLYNKLPETFLPETDPEINRKKLLKEKDDLDYNVEVAASRDDYENKKKNEEYEDIDDEMKEVDAVLELNRSFKTMQILGQIVKNFPGSLKANIKYDAVAECYKLGMRTLSGFMEIIDNNIEELTDELVTIHLKKTKRSNIGNEELRDEAKDFIFRICETVTFGIIKRISQSVNNEKLSETYKEVLSKNPSVAFELIDLSIKLDSLKGFPEKNALYLNEKLQKNYFSKSILNHLVFHYFYLYNCDYKVKQKVCDELGISYKKATVIEGQTIKVKKIQ